MKKVNFELIEFEGQPAVIFEDGDIVFQSDSLRIFLRHIETLRGECPEKLAVVEQDEDLEDLAFIAEREGEPAQPFEIVKKKLEGKWQNPYKSMWNELKKCLGERMLLNHEEVEELMARIEAEFLAEEVIKDDNPER